MTSAPSVSFIVPVHDGAPYLAECLASILGQTVAPLEVLVVDDGSTDRSGDIARSVGRPVRCLRQPHAGPARARNHGVAETKGEFIAFLDADDLLVPHSRRRLHTGNATRHTWADCRAAVLKSLRGHLERRRAR